MAVYELSMERIEGTHFAPEENLDRTQELSQAERRAIFAQADIRRHGPLFQKALMDFAEEQRTGIIQAAWSEGEPDDKKNTTENLVARAAETLERAAHSSTPMLSALLYARAVRDLIRADKPFDDVLENARKKLTTLSLTDVKDPKRLLPYAIMLEIDRHILEHNPLPLLSGLLPFFCWIPTLYTIMLFCFLKRSVKYPYFILPLETKSFDKSVAVVFRYPNVWDFRHTVFLDVSMYSQ